MMALGLALALVMGVIVGSLGGGGSILSVPILVYAFGLEAKRAIATSLLVVGTTSLVALIQHARHGRVLWRKGLLFGAFAMVGAFGGGRAATFVPGWLLLMLFAGMMVVTAVAMLRDEGDEEGKGDEPKASSHEALPKVAAEGLLVGAFTGLVGAGGGFLVVPALVLFGGVPMHAAIGTSLLVIAMKSFAGLGGYLGHVSIDPMLAAGVALVAVTGAVIGASISSRAPEGVLRRTFAWLVLGMGGFMLYQEAPIPADLTPAVAPLIGGVLIGLAASSLLLLIGRIAGISGIVAGLLRPVRGEVSWRVAFVVGLLFGGTLLLLAYPPALDIRAPGSLGLVSIAGLAVGFGTRLGNGCTSGHGVCGIGRLSMRSVLATVTFMITGAITVYFVHSPAGSPRSVGSACSPRVSSSHWASESRE